MLQKCLTREKIMKKLWGIRHIRFFWHNYHFNKHIDMCRSCGLGFVPQQSDIDYLEAILKGDA